MQQEQNVLSGTKKVIKRDGVVKEYEIARIRSAVKKAYDEVYGVNNEQFNEKVGHVVLEVNKKVMAREEEEINIEDIQDYVVEALDKVDKKVSKAYEEYREKRSRIRSGKSKLFDDIDGIFNQTSEEIVNNANKAGDKLQTYRAMIADVSCNNYADVKIIPQHILEEHGKSIYVHDKNYIAIPVFNCMLVNWMDMLDNGFKISDTYIESPKSFATAIALLSQIICHTTSNNYGGNTLPDLDLGLEKYMQRSYNKHLEVAKQWIDDEEKQKEYAYSRLEKEVEDGCQSLEYEILTIMNARGEIPFITISFGLSTTKFGRLFQKKYLEQRIKGYTDGSTPVFPKVCFYVKEGLNLNPEDINYDIFKLAVRCSSVRMYPDYLNVDKIIENTGDLKSPMSCRSFLGTWRNEKGELQTYGRFNQGVCSINLPRLAIQSNGDENKFYELLDNALELTRQVLMIRHNMLKGIKAKQCPILYTEGAVARLDPEETIDKLLYGGFSSISIGYVGLYNAMIALYGKAYDTEGMMDKGKAILQYLRDYCDKLKKETNIGFSLYSTPAETLATKFCRQDVKDFGIIEGVNDLGYYHNSFHFPAEKEITPFEKIDLESNFPSIASGGAINYVQFGNMENNLEALEEIIRYASTKVHYFGVNTRPDRCFKCGFKGLIPSQHDDKNDYKCPNCGNEDKSKMQIVARICGYLSSLSQRPTIDGKMKEMNTRTTHLGRL